MSNEAHHSLRQGFSFSVVMVGVLAILVPLLAFLQYRWIGQVSEAEREHLQDDLERSTRTLVLDVQSEFRSIPREFRRFGEADTLEAQLAISYDQWLGLSRHPDLIRSIHHLEYLEATGLRWRRFDPESGTLVEAPAPVSEDARTLWLAPRPNEDSFLALSGETDEDSVWFVIQRFRGVSWVFVELDAQYLWSEFIPTLVAAHFNDRDYDVMLLDPYSSAVLFRSEPDLSPANFEEPDRVSGFFSFQDPMTREFGRGSTEIAGRQLVPVRQPRQPGRRFASLGNFAVMGDFQLLVQHQAGSLESAVEQLRLRNLGVGFGILALLAATGAMIIIWAERVRSVGRLQMEFAAGISHELRTPLATIRTAAHNIASGVVKQPEQIREYAGIVQTEGRRLSSMVDQVIQFAQTEAGRRSYNLVPTDVAHVIERAASIEDVAGRIKVHIEADLPPVLADETALTHCVGNLLANALKFGAEEQPITVEARYDVHSDRIQISVENHGEGIDAADLPHLFEPFYRGHNVGHVAGSGLGLNLVKRMIEGQKGRVTVSSEPGQGAVFTLHVPASKIERHTATDEAFSES